MKSLLLALVIVTTAVGCSTQIKMQTPQDSSELTPVWPNRPDLYQDTSEIHYGWGKCAYEYQIQLRNQGTLDSVLYRFPQEELNLLLHPTQIKPKSFLVVLIGSTPFNINAGILWLRQQEEIEAVELIRRFK